MGNSRQQGPMCQVTKPLDIDDGTMCRMPSPTPGVLASFLEYEEEPPAPEPPGVTVYVIGSPSKDQKFQYQFVDAAKCRPNDASTIWLVEKTGYEIYGVSLSYITKLAPAGGYGWITPKATLLGWLNNFKEHTIKNLVVFSHGLRGLIALRYGWDESISPNYGLTVDEAGKIDPKVFATNPSVEFDSCNSGVAEASGGLSVAQALANRLNTAVGGWTGRTSYADINSGASCKVQGSGQTHNPFSSETYKELWSRHKAGADPEYQLFQPKAQ